LDEAFIERPLKIVVFGGRFFCLGQQRAAFARFAVAAFFGVVRRSGQRAEDQQGDGEQTGKDSVKIVDFMIFHLIISSTFSFNFGMTIFVFWGFR
jgi:hypothetical protein